MELVFLIAAPIFATVFGLKLLFRKFDEKGIRLEPKQRVMVIFGISCLYTVLTLILSPVIEFCFS